MAANNEPETRETTDRWYCHTCESETEPLLDVSMLLLSLYKSVVLWSQGTLSFPEKKLVTNLLSMCN